MSFQMLPEMMSQKERLLQLPQEEQDAYIESLTEDEALDLLYDWEFNARPKQLEGFTDPLWGFWLILAGRGFGKTRTGAEWVRDQVENKGKRRIGIIAPTGADLRDVIVEGESGIIAVSHPNNKPNYEPTKRRVTWPNGAIATLYSAEEPERLRGPQHDAIWCLAGDTLVATQLGEIPISRIDPKIHKVWTPWGLKKIYTQICTNPSAETYVVSTPNGIIKGTSSHLVYSDGKFKPLGELECVTHVKNISEKCTTSDHLEGMNLEGKDWLEWSTKMRLAKYLPGMNYIIRTLTARMIQLRIWKYSHQKSITKNILNNAVNSIKNVTNKLLSSRKNVFSARKSSLSNNGQPKQQPPCVRDHVSTTTGDQNSNLKLALVKFAKRLIEQCARFKNTAAKHVTQKQGASDVQIVRTNVESIVKSVSREPVYDIGVEGGVFFANGFLVHNCDEIAGWANGNAETIQRTWDMAMFGLRLGTSPQVCITTTPKPIPLVQMFLKWSRDKARQDEPSTRIKITTGSSYENKSNLAPTFMTQIAQYEGTALGRQEIHAEVLNLEDQGIVKRKWFKLWPADEKLPFFQYIIQSYDTAYTEKTHNDPTACTVWGVFENKNGNFCVMLLDAWDEHMQYPELRQKVVDEFKARYGGDASNPRDPGQLPDIVLIEEKGSGITLIQDMNRTNVPVRPYNPGKMDKVQRLHAVSHLVCNGRVYLLESSKVKGEPVTWSNKFMEEVCVFPMSLHDDYTDTFSQMLALLRDQNWLTIDPVEEEEDYADEKDSNKSKSNPYAQ